MRSEMKNVEENNSHTQHTALIFSDFIINCCRETTHISFSECVKMNLPKIIYQILLISSFLGEVITHRRSARRDDVFFVELI